MRSKNGVQMAAQTIPRCFYLKQEDVLLTEHEDLANWLAIDALEAALADLCPGEKLSVCQAKHRFRIEQ